MSSASSSTWKQSAVEPSKYTWTIEKFKDLTGFKYAPRFVPHSKYSSNFILNCSAKHEVYYQKYFTLIFLSIHNCDEDVVPVHYEISILDSNGVKHHSRDFKADFGRLNRKINSNADVQYRLSWDYLTDPANGLLVNGSLNINCELYVPQESSNLHPRPFEQQSKLSQDYNLLLENGKFADVSLVVGKKVFNAHKLVLAARSAVFCAMFEHSDTKESQESRVDIEDMSVEVFELLLRFIYTGKIDSLEQYASELLQAADRYQLDSLKSTCEQFLGSSLTVDNFSNVVILADMHSAAILKQKCIEFLIEHASDVVDTDEWNNLVDSHSKFACQLLKCAIKK